jgi:hypothetical protein
VIGMSNAVRNRPNPLRILNSDGQPHPVENVLAVAILVIGLTSFVLGIVLRNVTGAGSGLRVAATATGLIALAVGLYAQMVSATREQRVLIVGGIIAGFVGLAIGLGQGGF